MSEKSLTITQPDDWHVHLRDESLLNTVARYTARQFSRAIIMPNLQPAVTTVAQASEYRQRILNATTGFDFDPLMTLYLTDHTHADEIESAAKGDIVYAVKYYPAGATTNSAAGVTAIEKVYDTLEKMQEVGLPLLIHGEVTDEQVDLFDREAVFIDTVLIPLRKRFPNLKIVLEHVTTQQGVQFIQDQSENVAGTLTPHHLMLNRNAIFKGGIRPHYYCLPVLKREQHRQALLAAATSGDPRFFLGTDSAPHSQTSKESACGCAGIFSAHAALELYAHVFEQAQALDKLEAFASFHGPDFYGLARNTKKITIEKKSWTIDSQIHCDTQRIIPFMAGEKLAWQMVS